MTTRLRHLRLLAVAVLVVLAPVSVLLYRLAYGGDLPDPLPTHWDAGGDVDGTTGLATFTGTVLAMTGALAAVSLVLLLVARRRPSMVLGVVVGSWVAWVLATTYAAVLSAAAGAATAEDVALHPALVVAVLLVPSLVTAVVWLLVPFAPRRSGQVPTPASPLTLRADERVTWVGQASSPAMLLVGLALVLVAVGTVFVLWPLALTLGIVGLTVTWVHRIMVRVDDQAVTVAWGPARWPRVTVPLSDVTAAHPTTIEPLAWGGWGYRVTPRGHAAVARRGPGLVLSRRDRSPFAVTVDAPADAADLVNAVLARNSSAG